MQRASDSALWTYAREHGYVLVSKDEDFVQLADRYGAPPQVVWVRLGNCRKQALLAAFQRILPALRETPSRRFANNVRYPFRHALVWRLTMRGFSSLIFVLALSACSANAFVLQNRENIARLEFGMSKDQVVGLWEGNDSIDWRPE